MLRMEEEEFSFYEKDLVNYQWGQSDSPLLVNGVTHLAISGLRTFHIMHTDDYRLTVNRSCSLKVSSHLGSRFQPNVHKLATGPMCK